MTLQRCFLMTATCLTFFCSTITAWAQFPIVNQSGATPYPSISTSGTSTVKRLPDTIRVIIPVLAKGKSMDEAFANLKAEQQTAQGKIQKIGAKQENIKFEGFSIDQSQDNKRQQMEAMIAQRMRQSGPKPTAAAESVVLKCMLSVEWPITGTTVEEILKESYALKQKIKAADFAPKKEELTPEEEEMEEEMESMNYRSGNSESNNEPRFLFISNITEEESQKAYSEAFAQAQKQGEFLAKAANLKLGTLMQLSANLTKNQGGSNSYRGYEEYYNDYYVMQMLQSQQFGADPTKQMECVTLMPDYVEFVFIVQTVFMMDK